MCTDSETGKSLLGSLPLLVCTRDSFIYTDNTVKHSYKHRLVVVMVVVGVGWRVRVCCDGGLLSQENKCFSGSMV